MKYKKDESNSGTSKSDKKSKHKKEKSRAKGKKKHKKGKRSSSSSNDSSTEDEQIWVEKETQPSTSTESKSVTSKEEEPLKREDWMNLNNLFPCVSNPSNAERKRNAEEDTDRSILDRPGQSDRELNPYWKNGGTGLPEERSRKSGSGQIVDVNWLKKSLQRAQEQAISQGKSLYEIAAERWGSLEKIESMIANAERAAKSNRWRDDSRNSRDSERRYKLEGESRSRGRYESDNRHSHRNEEWRRANRSKSRSRSRDRYDRYKDAGEKRKAMYKKPSDDDYFGETSHKTGRSHKKNWRKEMISDTALDQQSKPIAPQTQRDNLGSEDKMENDTKNDEVKMITEAELNKLGARIVKAEIMGDNELAAELKVQLEDARKRLKKTGTSESAETETVILTRTDAKGVVRPLEPRSQTREASGHSRRKKNVETHVSGERVRHFFDDDKYSLDQLFQREKGRSANEDDAMFTKIVSKSMDMNDIFEEQITRAQSDAREDERDRAQAIKEHKRLTKSLDNCRWCIDSKYMLKHMIVTMNSKICLSLPSHASLTEGHCVLTPVQHTACQLQLDEDVWKELKMFKRLLCRMFKNREQCPIFFEIYKSRHKFSHMQLECVPLPIEFGVSAPMYFKKALLECETEWSVNKKVIDLKDRDVRQAVPNGLSYFVVEFEGGGGYAHVIEDERMFPNNFAEEIIGGMLDLDHDLWRKPRRENFEEQREKVLKFSSMWKEYDGEFQSDAD